MKKWMCVGVVLSAFNVAHAAGIVAAAGRVEPVGEERIVIAEASGRLKSVLVNEGDVVKRDQLLAEIDNKEQHALVSLARAQLQQRQAELNKMKTGARAEELTAIRAAEQESDAWLRRKQQELERREQLFVQQQLSADQRDELRAVVAMAQASRDRLRAQREQMEAGNRVEDRQMAQAAYQMAQAELARAEAQLEKTRIRSPIDGTVLKRELREGETVTSLNPLPLVRIGDLSRLIVRAEIDELDITRVKKGDTATVTADAFPAQSFIGKVIYVGRRMGNRLNKTDNPADKEDVRVLETLIELQQVTHLPVGLRVDVKINVK